MRICDVQSCGAPANFRCRIEGDGEDVEWDLCRRHRLAIRQVLAGGMVKPDSHGIDYTKVIGPKFDLGPTRKSLLRFQAIMDEQKAEQEARAALVSEEPARIMSLDEQIDFARSQLVKLRAEGKKELARNVSLHLDSLLERRIAETEVKMAEKEAEIAAAMLAKVVCVCPQSHQAIYKDISQMKATCPRCRMPWVTVNNQGTEVAHLPTEGWSFAVEPDGKILTQTKKKPETLAECANELILKCEDVYRFRIEYRCGHYVYWLRGESPDPLSTCPNGSATSIKCDAEWSAITALSMQGGHLGAIQRDS